MQKYIEEISYALAILLVLALLFDIIMFFIKRGKTWDRYIALLGELLFFFCVVSSVSHYPLHRAAGYASMILLVSVFIYSFAKLVKGELPANILTIIRLGTYLVVILITFGVILNSLKREQRFNSMDKNTRKIDSIIDSQPSSKIKN